MMNSKAIVILISASVLVAAVAGIAFAQYVGAQTSGNNPTQTPKISNGISGTTYGSPQGYNPYGYTQNGYPFGVERGMGMCSRFW